MNATGFNMNTNQRMQTFVGCSACDGARHYYNGVQLVPRQTASATASLPRSLTNFSPCCPARPRPTATGDTAGPFVTNALEVCSSTFVELHAVLAC